MEHKHFLYVTLFNLSYIIAFLSQLLSSQVEVKADVTDHYIGRFYTWFPLKLKVTLFLKYRGHDLSVVCPAAQINSSLYNIIQYILALFQSRLCPPNHGGFSVYSGFLWTGFYHVSLIYLFRFFYILYFLFYKSAIGIYFLGIAGKMMDWLLWSAV